MAIVRRDELVVGDCFHELKGNYDESFKYVGIVSLPCGKCYRYERTNKMTGVKDISHTLCDWGIFKVDVYYSPEVEKEIETCGLWNEEYGA